MDISEDKREVWKRMMVPAAIGVPGLVSSFFLPAKAYSEVTQELIALFGLFMAAVLPTMALTATAIRPGGFDVKRIMDLQAALTRQIRVWMGLFWICLVTSALIIIGKMTGWEIMATFSHPPLKSYYSVNLVFILNGAITSSIVLVLLRSSAVMHGIQSLIRLSAETAIGEINEKDDRIARGVRADISAIPTDDDFGKIIDLDMPKSP